jgi:hypothetical protein
LKRLLPTAFVALLLPLFALPAVACSVMSCPVNGGIEVRREFVVMVTHYGRPMPGAKVEVTTASERSLTFSGVTGSDGGLRVVGVPAGDYWLNIELLGINAAYQCFHIAQSKPSRNAKAELKYEWGDNPAPAMRRVSGRMEDSQPATGGTPLWNISHYVTMPIIGASLQLQNAITREVFTAVSDDEGAFMFDPVPNGTYVLHIDGRTTGRTYDPTDLLVKISRDATTTAVVFKRVGPSNCGDISLMPSWVR